MRAAAPAPPPQLPTPTLSTRSAGLFKPQGTTTLFKTDVLVVTPADPSDTHAVPQFKIEEYEGTKAPSLEWQDARQDPATGQWGFTLPPGLMRVRVGVRSAGKAGSSARASDASVALVFEVKGAWASSA